MISEYDVVYIVRLFLGGFVVGGLLTTFPFLIGYIVDWLFRLVGKEE